MTRGATYLTPWQSFPFRYQSLGLDPGLPEQPLQLHAYVGSACGSRQQVALSWKPGLGSNGQVDQRLLDIMRLVGYDVVIVEAPGVGMSPGFANAKGQPLRFQDVKDPLTIVTAVNRALTALINGVVGDGGPLGPVTHVVQGGHSYGGSMVTGLISTHEVVDGAVQPKEAPIARLAGGIALAGGIRGPNPPRRRWYGTRVHWYIHAMANLLTNGYARSLLSAERVAKIERRVTGWVYRLFGGNQGNRDFSELAERTALKPGPEFGLGDLIDRLETRILHACLGRHYLGHPAVGPVAAAGQGQIRVPFVNLLAANDPIIPPGYTAQAVRDTIPAGRAVVLHSAQTRGKVSHMFPHTHPMATAALMNLAIQSAVLGTPLPEAEMSSRAQQHGLQLVFPG